MGKALIVSGGTAGSYSVKPLHNRERIDAETAAIESRLEEIAPELEEITEAFEFAELEVAEAKMYTDALIDRLEEEGALPPVDLVELVQLHNSARSGAGSLTAVDKLNSAAQAHADDLADNNITGHVGSTGSTLRQRVTSAGYSGTVGENVAWGQSSAEAAVNAWMLSPGHRRNILRPEWQHIGVGYACRSDGYRHFWVAVFGEDGAASAQSPTAPSNCVGEDGDIPELIRESIEDLAKASAERNKINIEREQLVARQLSLGQRLAARQQIPADADQAAWCADYTETLAGEVATAEIPGEGKARIIVRPGYDGRAAYVAARDGQLFHRAGQSPGQAYFNAAILPGIQKWKPTYRVGVLTAVSDLTDTCSLTLDYELSSAYDLPINQATSLTGVPIEYMDCDADAFEVGDRVLVQFQGRDWGSPKVIGFESNPKECPVEWPAELRFRVYVNALDGDETNITTGEQLPFISGISRDSESTCCGWSGFTEITSNVWRRSLSYGGPGGVVAVMEDESKQDMLGPSAPEWLPGLRGFNGEADVLSDKVPIDYLYLHVGDIGRISFHDHRFQPAAEPRHWTAFGGFTANATQNVRWEGRSYFGYQLITLQSIQHCIESANPSNPRTGWVGYYPDVAGINGSGDYNSALLGCGIDISISRTDTIHYLSRPSSGITGEWEDVTALAIAKASIDQNFVLVHGTSTRVYVASGTIDGAGDRAFMRYIREDLLPAP